MNLRLDWCSYEAAKYAVMNWHYSKTMPVGKLVKIGVWEDNKYIGVILFGLGGGNSTNGKQYNMKKSHDITELVRVALYKHINPVTKIISIAIKMIRKQSPKLKMIISFADQMGQGHLGKIYQAGNWIYTGQFTGDDGFIINNKVIHNRSVYSKGWKQNIKWLKKYVDPKCKINHTIKHRYLYPLDKEIREQIKPLAKPYPKKICDSGVMRSTASFQDVGGGAIPTESLQLERQYA